MKIPKVSKFPGFASRFYRIVSIVEYCPPLSGAWRCRMRLKDWLAVETGGTFDFSPNWQRAATIAVESWFT
jgi:hypothetical protein